MSDSTKHDAAIRDLKAQGLGYGAIGKEIGQSKGFVRHRLIAMERAGAGQALVPFVEAIPEPETAAEFAARIKACLSRTVQAFVEIGRLLNEAKKKLEHGDFQNMVERELPFGPRHARRFMAIAADARITNRTHESVLPPAVNTLAELTKLDDATFDARIADGTICPDMERRDIAGIIKRERRATRERDLGARILALPSARFGIILADPEWKFETWSEAGMDRAPDNHYSTSATEVIAARDVPSICADDSILFLWVPVPVLPAGLLVMEAWGFRYVSSRTWVKDKQSTGYWFRIRHELLLVGSRGKPIAPAMGTQFDSVIEAKTRGHSVKPDEVYEMIEALWPNTPKIELNARRARLGWTPWGDEAPVTEAAE